MHTLHTTPAFVVGSYPHGESNRVYRLLTRDLGFLYAHGQGVRELRNRNRYALNTGTHTHVTLVRGREVWRITGATSGQTGTSLVLRKVLTLVGKLAPQEESSKEIYDHCAAADRILTQNKDAGEMVELLTVMRVLRVLGYLDLTAFSRELRDMIMSETMETGTLAIIQPHQQHLLAQVNNALAHAFE